MEILALLSAVHLFKTKRLRLYIEAPGSELLALQAGGEASEAIHEHGMELVAQGILEAEAAVDAAQQRLLMSFTCRS